MIAIHKAARQDREESQRAARQLAFALAEGWIDGLLADAARRGDREAAVAARWAARSGTLAPAMADDLDRILTGAPAPVTT